MGATVEDFGARWEDPFDTGGEAISQYKLIYSKAGASSVTEKLLSVREYKYAF